MLLFFSLDLNPADVLINSGIQCVESFLDHLMLFLYELLLLILQQHFRGELYVYVVEK